MAIFDELLPAQYKEVPFLVTSAETPGGIKHVKHVFPNSSNQVIEELGTRQRTYLITAVITGDNYLQRRNRLLQALENGSTGILIHPLYGALDNIKAVSWTPREDFTRIGEFVISITFEVDTGQVVPIPTQNTVSIINQANNNVVDALNTNITDNYSITNTFTENFLDAIDQGNQIIEAFNSNTSFLAVSADQIDLFSSEISNFGNNLTTLIRNPSALATSIANLFSTVNGLYTTTEATLVVLTKFFDFGNDDPEIQQTTVIRTERRKNRNILRGTMQTSALSYGYLNASQIEFTNVVEIQEAETVLENQFQEVIQLEDLTDPVVNAITDIRVQTQQFFTDQKLRVDQIINVLTPETSTRLLSFRYYGETENANTIQGLNNLTDVSFISGQLDIVTE